MKRLVRANPQHFVHWLLKGAQFKDKIDREWSERKFTMYNDIINESWVLQEATQKGKREELNRWILRSLI